jgi:Phage integrase family
MTGTDLATLRDRALLSVMLFNVPRVSAVVGMRVRDFDDSGDGWLVLHEKRNKERRLPAHHQVREAFRAYLAASGLGDPANTDGGKAPLFQGIPARSGKLSGRAMHRNDAWAMVKRRCAAAGLPTVFRTHSFRTTGANLHLQTVGSSKTCRNSWGTPTSASPAATSGEAAQASARKWNASTGSVVPRCHRRNLNAQDVSACNFRKQTYALRRRRSVD